MQRLIDHARLLGKLPNGVRVYRVPVDIDANNSRNLSTQRVRVYVDAPNTREALRLVREELADRPETELTAYGPRGGEERCYIGWTSAVWAAMQSELHARQYRLDLPLARGLEA
jgi:hypothetical protein